MIDSIFDDSNSPDISVIVTVYNQPVESVIATLASIVLQEDCTFEIIIADDCSTINQTSYYKEFLEDIGFKDYAIIRSDQNIQTVRNLIQGVRIANAPIIKQIGSGDLLYDCRTLRTIIDFMNYWDVSIGFGYYVAFSVSGNHISARRFDAPRNSVQYAPGKSVNSFNLLKNMLNFADWIPGGAQFFKKDVFLRYLDILSSDFSVRYCEDFAASIALMDDVRVAYLDEPVIWYEMGVGISTNPTSSSVKRMYRDHESFYSGVRKKRPFGSIFPQAQVRFCMRRFIALYTPVYPWLQKVVANKYLNDRRGGCEPNSFFYQCTNIQPFQNTDERL